MLYNNNKRKKGMSFTEIVISTMALSVLMLGFSEFTASMFNVSANHANQIENVNYARLSSERVITEINKAAYIYPSNINIQLNGKSINTNNSIAMLIENNDGNYIFMAYYMNENNDLCEYISSQSYSWDKNTCPATSMLDFNGNFDIIAKNINIESTNLQYILNYENSSYDENLKGEIGNASVNSSNALIKGVNWNISQGINDLQTIQIKGISRNVPRFFE